MASFWSSTSVEETKGAYRLKGGGLTAIIDSKTGFLQRVQRGSKTYSLTGGPRIPFGESKLIGVKVDGAKENSWARVMLSYTGDLKEVVWFIQNDGWLRCHYTYSTTITNDYFGVVFDYPESLVKKKC